MASKIRRVAARLGTYATYVRERPSWLLVLLVGRILFVRKLERRLNGKAPAPFVMPGATRLQVDGPERIIAELVATGVSTRLRLQDSDTAEIRAFAESTRCTTRLPPIRSFFPSEIDAINRDRVRDVIAAYYFEAVEQCPTIGAIVRDPLLSAVTAAYIGSEPKHIRTRLWWSFPGRDVSDSDLHASAQEKYHFDLNGFRTLKFFFYLTDVDSGSGPHAYIGGSHAARKLKYQLTMMVGHDEADLRSSYGQDNFQTVSGLAGTGFIEDPFIFHTGRSCTARPRLLLEIEFGPVKASDSYMYGALG